MPKLNNVELHWCKLNPERPEEGKYEPAWSLTAIVDEETYVDWVKSGKTGAKEIKDKETLKTTGYKITFRRKAERKDGKDQKPVEVLDGKLQPIDMTATGIANGSYGNIIYRTYEYDNKFGKGVGVELTKVQLTKFIPYVFLEEEEFEQCETVVEEAVGPGEGSTPDDDGVPF